MELSELFNKIKELAKNRKWFTDDHIDNCVTFNDGTIPYIRLNKRLFDRREIQYDRQILIFLVQIIYQEIPEAKDSKVKLYLSSEEGLYQHKNAYLRLKESHIIL